MDKSLKKNGLRQELEGYSRDAVGVLYKTVRHPRMGCFNLCCVFLGLQRMAHDVLM